MNISLPIIDKFNAIVGVVVTILSYILGEHYILFIAFLLLNVADYITGCLKSRINGKSNSLKGATGVLKKLGYWIMIAVAFGMSGIFIEIGNTININLEITQFLGWFVLATLIINELRSIVENFVEAGYNVPAVLVKGLEVANKAIDGTINLSDGSVNMINEEAHSKNQVTLQVEKDTNQPRDGDRSIGLTNHCRKI